MNAKHKFYNVVKGISMLKSGRSAIVYAEKNSNIDESLLKLDGEHIWVTVVILIKIGLL